MSRTPARIDDATAAEIKHALSGLLIDLITDDLGKPTSSGRGNVRWGRKGSVSAERVGSGRGLWHDHERGEGGDALAWLRMRWGLSYPDALAYGADLAGISLGTDLSPEDRTARNRAWAAARADREAARHAEDERHARIEAEAHEAAAELARATWDELTAGCTQAGPHPYAVRKGITTSTAAIARQDVRGCLYDRKAGRWRDAARAVTAGDLVIPMRDAAGAIVNLQAIRADGLKRFLMGGAKRGTFHAIPGREPGFVVEGYATGCTVAEATGRAVFVAFDAGNLTPVAAVLGGRAIAVAADNDESGTGEREARETGLHVLMPPTMGEDWNDHAARTGMADAAALLALCEPPGLSIEDARTVLSDALHVRSLSAADAWNARHPEGYEAEAKDAREIAKAREQASGGYVIPEPVEPPPLHVISCSTGTGKSHQIRAAILENLRSGASGIAVYAPRIDLCDEQAELLRRELAEAGLKREVLVWRGRRQPDPDAPDKTMCRNLEQAGRLLDAGLSVSEHLCDAREDDEDGGKRFVCPFADVCGHRAQRGRQADVIYMAHEMLFQKRPAPFGGRPPTIAFIDETPALCGINAPQESSALPCDHARLMIPGTVLARIGNSWKERRLSSGRGLIEKIAEINGPGPVRIEALREAGCGRQGLRELAELESKLAQRDRGPLAIDVTGLLAGDRGARQDAEAAALAGKMAGIFRAFLRLMIEPGNGRSGHVEFLPADRPGGALRIMLKSRKTIRDEMRCPTVIMSATPSFPLLKARWPEAELIAEAEARTPHMRIEQAPDRAYGKRGLVGVGGERAGQANDQEASRRQKARRDLRALIGREARGYERVLVVMQKPVEEASVGGGTTLPPNVETAHYNALAGLDKWGPGDGRPGIDRLILVGAPRPNPIEVERIAEALSGYAVDRLDRFANDGTPNGFPEVERIRRFANGLTSTGPDRGHPDPIADAVLQAITHAEIVQAIGRARGVNRTAENPCDVLILADEVLPVPVDRIRTRAETDATPYDLMAAEGFVLTNGRDAGRAYFGVLWGDAGVPDDNREQAIRCAEEAAKKAIGRMSKASRARSEVGDKHHSIIPMENVPNLGGFRRAEYRKEGPGQKAARVWVAESRCADAEAWLADRLGALALFRWTDQSPADPPPAPRPPRLTDAPLPADMPRLDRIMPPPGPDPRPAVSAAEVPLAAQSPIGTCGNGTTATAAPLPDPDAIVLPRIPARLSPYRPSGGAAPPWRVGGIDRADAALVPIERDTGHGLGAEDDADDPALAWLGCELRRGTLSAIERGMLGEAR